MVSLLISACKGVDAVIGDAVESFLQDGKMARPATAITVNDKWNSHFIKYIFWWTVENTIIYPGLTVDSSVCIFLTFVNRNDICSLYL